MADYPFLGAQYHKDKTVFRVQSEHAAGMELCLFSPDEKEETPGFLQVMLILVLCSL